MEGKDDGEDPSGGRHGDEEEGNVTYHEYNDGNISDNCDEQEPYSTKWDNQKQSQGEEKELLHGVSHDLLDRKPNRACLEAEKLTFNVDLFCENANKSLDQEDHHVDVIQLSTDGGGVIDMHMDGLVSTDLRSETADECLTCLPAEDTSFICQEHPLFCTVMEDNVTQGDKSDLSGDYISGKQDNDSDHLIHDARKTSNLCDETVNLDLSVPSYPTYCDIESVATKVVMDAYENALALIGTGSVEKPHNSCDRDKIMYKPSAPGPRLHPDTCHEDAMIETRLLAGKLDVVMGQQKLQCDNADAVIDQEKLQGGRIFGNSASNKIPIEFIIREPYPALRGKLCDSDCKYQRRCSASLWDMASNIVDRAIDGALREYQMNQSTAYRIHHGGTANSVRSDHSKECSTLDENLTGMLRVGDQDDMCIDKVPGSLAECGDMTMSVSADEVLTCYNTFQGNNGSLQNQNQTGSVHIEGKDDMYVDEVLDSAAGYSDINTGLTEQGNSKETNAAGNKGPRKKRGRFKKRMGVPSVAGRGRKHKSLAETYEELVPDDTDLPNALSCPVCWDVLYSAQTCRPCEHVFCEPCLRRLAKVCKDAMRAALCPICREPIGFCVKNMGLSKQIEELFPDDYHRRRRTDGRSRFMSHPLPSQASSIQTAENIAQILATRRQQRRHPRAGYTPIRMNVWRFVSFALVFILLKGMVGIGIMLLYNMSLGYVIGDMLMSVPRLMKDMRMTNIVFSWLCSAFAFSLTALVFFMCKKLYERYWAG